jgi:hypothetical protein
MPVRALTSIPTVILPTAGGPTMNTSVRSMPSTLREAIRKPTDPIGHGTDQRLPAADLSDEPMILL